jgi:hypothetical protein
MKVPGELGVPAERTAEAVDPVNLIRVIPA